jgi:hypothetical protein
MANAFFRNSWYCSTLKRQQPAAADQSSIPVYLFSQLCTMCVIYSSGMRRVVVMQLIKVDPAHKRLQTIITKYNAGLISCSGFDLLSAAAAHDAFAEAIGFVRYTPAPLSRSMAGVGGCTFRDLCDKRTSRCKQSLPRRLNNDNSLRTRQFSFTTLARDVNENCSLHLVGKQEKCEPTLRALGAISAAPAVECKFLQLWCRLLLLEAGSPPSRPLP